MGLGLITFGEPYVEEGVQLIQRLRSLNRYFAKKTVYDTIEPLNLAFGFGCIGLCISEANAEFGTCARHAFGTKLFAVVEIHRLGYAVQLDGVPKAVFHNRLIKCRIEGSVQYIARGIVDEGNKVHLFVCATITDRQIRAELNVSLPQLIALLVLKASGRVLLGATEWLAPKGMVQSPL
jgi:hypothetical protein